MPVKASFVEYEDVVQALPANGSDDAFDIRPLPRRTRRGQHLFDPHGLDLMNEVLPKDPIAIPQQIAWCSVPWKGLPKLLYTPFRCGMSGHGKMEYPPAVMRQPQKHVQDLKLDGRTVKKSTDTMLFTWLSRKVFQVCEGGLLRRIMYLLTLVSPMSIPSFKSSP